MMLEIPMRLGPACAVVILSAAALAGCDRAAAPDRPASPALAPVEAAPEAPAPAPEAPAATPSPGEQGGGDDWRAVATPADASLLGRLDQAWRLARAEAEERGFADEVESLGVLVDPNAGQAGRLQPPPGARRLRTIQPGARESGQAGLGGLAYVA